MNISEIIQYSHGADSFRNIVPLTSLRSREDVEAARANSIDAALTLDEFREKFPGVECGHICFGNTVSTCAYYWDPEALIVFALPIVNGEFSSVDGVSLAEMIEEKKRESAEQIRANDYYPIIYALNDRMRMEYLRMLIDRDVPGLYGLFLRVYPLSDYGCGSLGVDGMEKLLSRKTEAQAAETAKRLENLPDVVTLYRGESRSSAPYREAFSWTLSSGRGLHFATRSGEENSRLYKAKVKKEDIFECFESGEEVLVMPDRVFDVEDHGLLGLEWLTGTLSAIAPAYQAYLNAADYTKIPFETDGDIHGKAHCARVLLDVMLIARLRGLSREDEQLLAEAALYHDVGRTADGGDRLHGAIASKKYKKARKGADPVTLFLMKYHCRPDEEGYEAIARIPGLRGQEDRARRLLDVFKDADALDRVRLGAYETDWEQFRTEEGRQLPLAARLILAALREQGE